MSKGRWRFAANSLGGNGHHHQQLALVNDPTPTIRCVDCGKAWSLLPPKTEPTYYADDSEYGACLDNRPWAASMRTKRARIEP